jgi:ferredoxin
VLPSAHRHVCFSRPGPDDQAGRDYQSAGRLSAAVLSDLGVPGIAAATASPPHPPACRTGVCHTYQTALMSGMVGYCPDPVDDPAEGGVLICCSQPREDLVLDL